MSKELFLKEGFGATTMSAVAEAARISKTTLYSRVSTKAELFRAVVAAQIESWGKGPNRTPVEHAASLDELLLMYGDIALRAGLSPDFIQLNRMVYAESRRFPELRATEEARFAMGATFLAEHFRSFAEKDQIPCQEPEKASTMFLMTLSGWCHAQASRKRLPSAQERAEWLEYVVRSFMAGRSAW